MKIKTLDIYGYGKWVNQRFELKDQLQLFYGQNEAGKSTLQSFIRSMLFGFPTKRKKVNQPNRYEPKLGEVYGGRLLLTETSHGDIWIERTQKGLKITNTAGDLLPNKTLDEVLGGLNETLYDNFYAFNLQNLQELANIDVERLSDYFLSIGTVGSDKFLSLAKQLEKATDDLYRPQGQSRPLNQVLSQYDELAQKVDRMKQSMGRYDALNQAKQEQEAAIEQINQSINQLETQIRDLDKLLGRYDIYLKDRTVKRELEQLIFTPIPEEGSQKLMKASNENKQANEELIQLQERIQQLKTELHALTRLNWANNHEDQRRQWVVQTLKIKEIQAKIEQLTERVREQDETMTQLAVQGQFYPDKIKEDLEFDEQMEAGLAIQTQKIELTKQQDTLKAERKVFLQQRKEQQQYSVTVRQQVAQLEAERMNQEAQLVQETSLKHYFFGALFLITGLAVLLVKFMTPDSSKMFLIFGLIFSLIGLASIGYIFSAHRRRFADYRNDPILSQIQDLREKEADYYEQSKQTGLQINQRDEVIDQLANQLAKLGQEQIQWLKQIGFYPSADPELILKANPVKNYFQAKQQKEHFLTEIKQLEQKVEEWKTQIQPLLERFPSQEEATRQLIRHVEEIEVDLVKTQEKGQQIDARIQEAKSQIQKNQELISSNQSLIQSLFDQTNSQNELDFMQKVETNNRIEELNDKHSLYQEQMVGFEDALAQIKNKQSLIEDYHRLEHQLELAKESLAPHHHERANLLVEISHLEQDGTYQDLSQELENKKAEVREMALTWGKKRMAMEMIYRTLRQGLDNPLPEMNRIADEIFSTLSYGRYTQIKLNKTGIKVKQFSDILFEPHELSQGTLEQLYVALRIAFVINAREMVKMPIIIDDAFVNFDELRKTSMYQVLEKIAKEMQVLFFTFDLQARESFSEDIRIDLSVLENNKASSEA
ncbi:ATP-binding protein [Vaginisenegalia massiliensis]|uniref:ATP-binding protein n=1 Tax=Vaginisenegalia massiliensis TaxID=2058294 RepID=UPI000F52FDB4|nr:AAA family ATPase [Vaginisenegalia massiliensis]